MIGFLIVIGAVLFIWCTGTILGWFDSSIDAEKISFKSFVSFYNIAPNKWEIRDDHVVRKNMHPGTYYSNPRNQKFCFSFCDYLKYKKWYKKMEKEKEENKSNETMAKLIKEVRKDLEEYNKKGF